MPVMTKSAAPGVSMGYITIGAILAVLSGTSFFFFSVSADHPILGYLRAVALLLGLVLFSIGFAAGFINRVAREADEAPIATGTAPQSGHSAKPASPFPAAFTTGTNPKV